MRSPPSRNPQMDLLNPERNPSDNRVVDTSPRAGSVTYADGTTAVLPGDRVSVRFFLRRRPGEVIYVPGISPRRADYDHHGLTWVGVSLPKGWAIGTIVLPETQRLQKGVRFLGRGTESQEAAEAVRRLDQIEEEEAGEEEQEDEEPAAGPVPRPKLIDWIAGFVAVSLQLG